MVGAVDEEGDGGLAWAAWAGYEGVVEWLLQLEGVAKAVDEVDHAGDTALCKAARMGHVGLCAGCCWSEGVPLWISVASTRPCAWGMRPALLCWCSTSAQCSSGGLSSSRTSHLRGRGVGWIQWKGRDSCAPCVYH